MPSKLDKVPIKDPFLDRRCKLLPCQKEMVFYWYEKGLSINAIARLFKVNKRTIQFILDPEKLKKNREKYKDRGGWQHYYNKEDHAIAIKDHRHYKKSILKK